MEAADKAEHDIAVAGAEPAADGDVDIADMVSASVSVSEAELTVAAC